MDNINDANLTLLIRNLTKESGYHGETNTGETTRLLHKKTPKKEMTYDFFSVYSPHNKHHKYCSERTRYQGAIPLQLIQHEPRCQDQSINQDGQPSHNKQGKEVVNEKTIFTDNRNRRPIPCCWKHECLCGLSGIIAQGEFSVYKKGKFADKMSGITPVTEETLLVCESNCLIKTKGIALIVQDGTEMAV